MRFSLIDVESSLHRKLRLICGLWKTPVFDNYLSFGKVVLSYGKEGSSVRCQWKTFNLFISIRSRLSIRVCFGRKCLEVSNIKPRNENRGKSFTVVPLMKYNSCVIKPLFLSQYPIITEYITYGKTRYTWIILQGIFLKFGWP